jgi:hypothetical protein
MNQVLFRLWNQWICSLITFDTFFLSRIDVKIKGKAWSSRLSMEEREEMSTRSVLSN